MINRLFYSFVVYTAVSRVPFLARRFDPVVLVALVNLMIWAAVAMVKRKHVIYHKVVQVIWRLSGRNPRLLLRMFFV